MKKKIRTAVRVAVMLIMILMDTFGYVCYQQTLIAWWLPVVLAAAVSLVTLPFLRGRWRWLVGSDKTIGLLCHLFVVGCVTYSLFMCGNFLFADEFSVCPETVIVENKEHVTRNSGYRSGRSYRRSNRKTHSYYVTVRLGDGRLKEMSVTSDYYNRVRTGMPVEVSIQDGAFGFKVIKHN